MSIISFGSKVITQLNYSNAVIDQKLDYVHNNPVKAGWVDEPEHYLYSSARDYAGGKGLLHIDLMY